MRICYFDWSPTRDNRIRQAFGQLREQLEYSNYFLIFVILNYSIPSEETLFATSALSSVIVSRSVFAVEGKTVGLDQMWRTFSIGYFP